MSVHNDELQGEPENPEIESSLLDSYYDFVRVSWTWDIAIVQYIQTHFSEYWFNVVFLFHSFLVLTVSIIIDRNIFVSVVKLFSSVSNRKFWNTGMQLYYFKDRDE